MTAEQLEELLGKVTQGEWHHSNVTFTSVWGPNDEHIHYTKNGPHAESNAALIALAPSLARRVIAAEKLVAASEAFLSVMASTKKDQSLMEWCNTSGPLLDALNAYCEASK